jgi:adenylate kinase
MVVILGAPGVGKGTQAEILCRTRGWRHLATGDLLREAVAAGSPLGMEAKDTIERGDLVQDRIILGLMDEKLGEVRADGFVFDGFPRTVAQAEGLDAMLERRGEKVDRVVLLAAGVEVVVERLASRGRVDDTPETVRHRLRVYEEITRPVIGYYEPRGVLRRVDGVGEIQEIHRRIESVLAD